MMRRPRRRRARADLELELHPELKPAAEAALAVDLQRIHRKEDAGRLGLALVRLEREDAQIVRVQEAEDFQEGGGRGVPHDEGLAQIEVDVQGRVVALAVATHGFEATARRRARREKRRKPGAQPTTMLRSLPGR